jgi:hypothetical protein
MNFTRKTTIRNERTRKVRPIIPKYCVTDSILCSYHPSGGWHEISKHTGWSVIRSKNSLLNSDLTILLSSYPPDTSVRKELKRKNSGLFVSIPSPNQKKIAEAPDANQALMLQKDLLLPIRVVTASG